MKPIPAYIKITLFLISSGLIITGMIWARTILIPFFWSALLSMMILPVVNWLESLIKIKMLAIFITLLILIIVFGGILFLLSMQAYYFFSEIPELSQKLTPYLHRLRYFIESTLNIPYDQQQIEFMNNISSLAQQSAGAIKSIISNAISIFIMLALIPFFIFFLLMYKIHLSNFINKLYKDNHKNVTATILKSFRVARQYLIGMLIVTFIVAILAGTVFVVLGVKYALFFAVFVGIMNLIPYVGVFLSSFISVVYVFLTKDSLVFPILALSLLWGIQLLENNLITPYIIGKQIRINPIAMIMSIFAGGMVWGVSGMVLFIPLLGIIKIFLDESESLKMFGYLIGDEEEK